MIEARLDIWIPDGYMEMPLTEISERIDVAESLLTTVGTPEVRALTRTILPTVELLFGQLSARGTRYCGIGQHLSTEGNPVTSCLTVSVYETGGDELNPRLVLADLVDSRTKSGELGDTLVRHVDDRPMLFSERITELPTPEIPGRPYTSDTTATYQLEAVVPADDGSALAIVELSTVDISSGPEFRKMLVDMARSVSLQPSLNQVARPSSLDL
ncbi:hypothetical protein ACL02S_17235 [Nocardia sp. 004]|uniref:hypothetical protein n=1 Tax=Nocardia sp. 004 TaxID=3385978 RepID=UPI0039A1D35B